ncbi:MAG: Uma2 family endonuclease [Thermosynechococcus sp.]|uniref:Uma2 family endonuclease n=1 Tax=Thermosynechococcus sp. TaxID=2814275 RepID=UPI00391AAE5D
MIEVLSSGAENERRDRQIKLKLYSSQGVLEYWIADRRRQTVEIFRREAGLLKLALTLYREDTLTSPLLPNLHCPLGQIFES